MTAAEAQALYEAHRAIQVRGRTYCHRCPGRPTWPCRPVREALPVLNAAGYFN
jgi:hypothetical protein